jgi:hypothetical protein
LGDRDPASDYRGVVFGKIQHTIEVSVWPLSFIRGVLVYANALGALGGAIWPWHNGTGRRKWESLLETDAT